MKGMSALERCLDSVELSVHGRPPVLPSAKDFERHEVLAEDGGDEDTVLLVYDFDRGSAFFFNEERCVTIWTRDVSTEYAEAVEVIPFPLPM